MDDVPNIIFVDKLGLFQYIDMFNGKPRFKDLRERDWTLAWDNFHYDHATWIYGPKDASTVCAAYLISANPGDQLPPKEDQWKIWYNPKGSHLDDHDKPGRWNEETFKIRYSKFEIGQYILTVFPEYDVKMKGKILDVPKYNQYTIFFENMKQEMLVAEADCEVLTKTAVFVPNEGDFESMKNIIDKARPNFPPLVQDLIAKFSCIAGVMHHGLLLYNGLDTQWFVDQDLKSQKGGARVMVHYRNETDKTIRQWWFDGKGTRREYAPLDPRVQGYSMGTYLEHPWEFRIEDELVAGFVLKQIIDDLLVTFEKDGSVSVRLAKEDAW